VNDLSTKKNYHADNPSQCWSKAFESIHASFTRNSGPKLFGFTDEYLQSIFNSMDEPGTVNLTPAPSGQREEFCALNEAQWKIVLENYKQRELEEIETLEQQLRRLQDQIPQQSNIFESSAPTPAPTAPTVSDTQENPPSRRSKGKRKASEAVESQDFADDEGVPPSSIDSLLDANIYSLVSKDDKRSKSRDEIIIPDSDDEDDDDDIRKILAQMPVDLEIDSTQHDDTEIIDETMANDTQIETTVETAPPSGPNNPPPQNRPATSHAVNEKDEIMNDDKEETYTKTPDQNVIVIDPTMIVNIEEDENSINLDSLDKDKEDPPLTAPLFARPKTPPRIVEIVETLQFNAVPDDDDDDVVSDSDVGELEHNRSFDFKSPLLAMARNNPFEHELGALSPIRANDEEQEIKRPETSDKMDVDEEKQDKLQVAKPIENDQETQIGDDKDDDQVLTFDQFDSIHEDFLSTKSNEEKEMKDKKDESEDEKEEKQMEKNDDIFNIGNKESAKPEMITDDAMLDELEDEPITPHPRFKSKVSSPGSPDLLLSLGVSSPVMNDDDLDDDDEEDDQAQSTAKSPPPQEPISSNISSAQSTPQPSASEQPKPSQSALPLRPIEKIGKNNMLNLHTKLTVDNKVNCVSFSPISQHRLLVCTPTEVSIRELVGKEWHVILSYPCNVEGEEFYVAQFTPDADMLVVAGRFAESIYSPSMDEDVLDNGDIRGSAYSPPRKGNLPKEFKSGIRLYTLDDNNTSMFSDGGNNITQYAVGFNAHNGRINDLIIHSKHSAIISAGDDGSVIRFGLEDNWVDVVQQLDLETNIPDPITSLSFIEEVDEHVVGTSSSHIYVWNFARGGRLFTIPVTDYQLYRNNIIRVQADSNNKAIFALMIYSNNNEPNVTLSQTEQRHVGLFIIDMVKQQVRLVADYKRNASTNFTPSQTRDSFTAMTGHRSSNYLVAGTQKGKLMVFNYKIGQLVAILIDMDGERVTSTCVHKCAPLLCVGGDQGTVCIYYQA
jgi:hypothetical protein